MCGIYGMLARGTTNDGAALAPMDAALRHRGPDDSGTLLDGPCALGMRRLAIIDLDGGHQPIASEDRRVWTVFNGEIYNYRALRGELQERGHELRTASDTEVIVHLYEERGDDFPLALRGMFAAAVWDRGRGTLTLARDRLGIKPLYYVETDAGLLFASEMRALLTHSSVARALDPIALDHYFSFGTTPAERGAVRGVRKLPPGCVLRAEDGRVSTTRRYWDLRPPVAPLPEGEAIERVRALVEDAVRSHLASDVPVGAFLSGGLDSSTVVARMAAEGRAPHTFSIGFDAHDFDELAWARRVAARFGTRHEEAIVSADCWQALDEIVPALDEPFADVSAIPTWYVSRLAARRVKVVLSGDGGDEVFAGYDHYLRGLADGRLDRVPPLLRRALGRIAALLPDAVPGRRRLRHAALDPRLRFLDENALFAADRKARLLTPAFADAVRRARRDAGELDPVEARARLLEGAPGDALARLQYLDAVTYLPLDILAKVDRMSMAHSLEVRPPLLDAPLVEAVAALPSSLKARGGQGKWILRRAVEPWLPPEIVQRSKQGFGVPIRRWFRGPLRAVVEEELLDRRAVARGIVEPRYVRALLAEHRLGRRDHALRLWSLLVLERWTRAVLEGEARPAAPRATGIDPPRPPAREARRA